MYVILQELKHYYIYTVLKPLRSFLTATPFLTFTCWKRAQLGKLIGTSHVGNKELSSVRQPTQKLLPGWNKPLGKAGVCTRVSNSQKGPLIPSRVGHAPLSGITTVAGNVASAFLLSRHTIILPVQSCLSHLLPINPPRGLYQTCREAAIHTLTAPFGGGSFSITGEKKNKIRRLEWLMQGPRGVWGKSQLISQAETKAEGNTEARIKAQQCQQGDNAFAVLLCTRACYAAPLLQGKADLVSNSKIRFKYSSVPSPLPLAWQRGRLLSMKQSFPCFDPTLHPYIWCCFFWFFLPTRFPPSGTEADKPI